MKVGGHANTGMCADCFRDALHTVVELRFESDESQLGYWADNRCFEREDIDKMRELHVLKPLAEHDHKVWLANRGPPSPTGRTFPETDARRERRARKDAERDYAQRRTNWIHRSFSGAVSPFQL